MHFYTVSLWLLETAEKEDHCLLSLFAALGLLFFVFFLKQELSVSLSHAGDHSLLVKCNHLHSELGAGATLEGAIDNHSC